MDSANYLRGLGSSNALIRRSCAEYLTRTATATDLAEMIPHFNDEDEDVATYLFQSIARMGPAADVIASDIVRYIVSYKHSQPCYPDSPSNPLFAAIEALASIGDAVTECVSHLLDDRRPSIRYRAAAVLRRLSWTESPPIAALCKAYRDKDVWVRLDALFGFSRFSSHACEALPLIEKRRNRESIPFINTTIDYILAKIESPDRYVCGKRTIANMLAAASSADPLISEKAIEALTWIGEEGSRALPILLGWIDSDSDCIEAMLAAAIAFFVNQYEWAAQYFVRYFRQHVDRSPFHLLATAAEIGSAVQPDLENDLVQLLSSRDVDVRLSASFALYRIGYSSDALSALLNMITDESISCRKAAVRTLERAPHPVHQSIISGLENAAREPDEEVAFYARRSLHALRGDPWP